MAKEKALYVRLDAKEGVDWLGREIKLERMCSRLGYKLL